MPGPSTNRKGYTLGSPQTKQRLKRESSPPPVSSVSSAAGRLGRMAGRRAKRQQVQKALKTVRKAYKGRSVEVPEIVPPNLRRAVARQGQRLTDALKESGSNLSGPEYLGKLIEFESGWNPRAENPSSAYGLGQFIDSTADDFRNRLGVETQNPKKPKQMIKGAAMHASGKHGYGALYKGYNPGYSDTDPIPSVDSGRNVKVSLRKKKPVPSPALKEAKEVLKATGVKPGRRASTPKPKKLPGPWAGSQRAVLSVVPKSVRPEGRGDKRTPAENASVGGSATSDHLTSNPASYAADLPADDAVARAIAKRLGMASHTGTNEVTKNGYKYQLIWQTDGHYDHIHLGAEWTGAPSSMPSAFTGGSVSASGGTSSGTPRGKGKTRTERRTEKKRKLARVRAAYPDSPSSSDTSSELDELEKRYSAAV